MLRNFLFFLLSALVLSSAQTAQQCDSGIAGARRVASPAVPVARVANHEPEPSETVRIPGGNFWMGSEHGDMPDARPVHQVHVDSFWMDSTDVTNQQFEEFVSATGYVTVAERRPQAKDFPGVPQEKLVPGSVVFSPPRDAVSLQDCTAWWSFVAGANWRHPEGPLSSIAGRENHPVVQVAWEDAVAYARWSGKRLPTEAEWEFAARGGLDRQPYVWGAEFKPNGRWQANTFQGHFPDRNTAEDGYRATSPVRSFPANGFGLYDMAGNVWQWCADWYRPDYYAQLSALGGVARNPQGPGDGFDPDEPGVPKRVQKGGSFLCTDQYCTRYMPGSRGKGDPSTATNHTGFRCVRSSDAVRPT